MTQLTVQDAAIWCTAYEGGRKLVPAEMRVGNGMENRSSVLLVTTVLSVKISLKIKSLTGTLPL